MVLCVPRPMEASLAGLSIFDRVSAEALLNSCSGADADIDLSCIRSASYREMFSYTETSSFYLQTILY